MENSQPFLILLLVFLRQTYYHMSSVTGEHVNYFNHESVWLKILSLLLQAGLNQHVSSVWIHMYIKRTWEKATGIRTDKSYNHGIVCLPPYLTFGLSDIPHLDTSLSEAQTSAVLCDGYLQLLLKQHAGPGPSKPLVTSNTFIIIFQLLEQPDQAVFSSFWFMVCVCLLV